MLADAQRHLFFNGPLQQVVHHVAPVVQRQQHGAQVLVVRHVNSLHHSPQDFFVVFVEQSQQLVTVVKERIHKGCCCTARVGVWMCVRVRVQGSSLPVLLGPPLHSQHFGDCKVAAAILTNRLIFRGRDVLVNFLPRQLGCLWFDSFSNHGTFSVIRRFQLLQTSGKDGASRTSKRGSSLKLLAEGFMVLIVPSGRNFGGCKANLARGVGV
mmetsp:Transcript_31303/g.78550  ORF Transcript_31303/g.78550 Transcript_31303/m.78550 type:complete len:211 (+) Transcript_31303:1346-1978(+)